MKKFEKFPIPDELVPEGLLESLIKDHEKSGTSIKITLEVVTECYHEMVISALNSYNEVVEAYEEVCKEIEDMKKRFYH